MQLWYEMLRRPEASSWGQGAEGLGFAWTKAPGGIQGNAQDLRGESSEQERRAPKVRLR